MHRSAFIFTALAASAVTSASLVEAADIPLKAPPKAVVQNYGGYYIWVDGSYQVINLPTYDLGARRIAPVGTGFDTGIAVQSYDPRATGAGVAGAIGFFLPPGMLSMLGSNARIELGASYVDASQTQAAGPDSPRLALFPIGGGTNLFGCGAGVCSLSSRLGTDYQAWQINAKAAGDIRMGAVTWTPSITAFGGEARNNQEFSQSLVGPGFVGSYTAATSVRWTDWGAKAGLDAKADLSPVIAVGLGGMVGFAGRTAALSGSDDCIRLNGPGGCTGFADTNHSAVAASTTAIPLLANAEARVFVTPWRNFALKGFVGLNYDSRMPGIQKGTWVGDSGGGTVATPASIRFESLTSWYTGGGLTVKLN
jgi:hypothetical protein